MIACPFNAALDPESLRSEDEDEHEGRARFSPFTRTPKRAFSLLAGSLSSFIVLAPFRFKPPAPLLIGSLISSFLLCPLTASSAPPVSNSDPSADQREIWTPREQLKEVLARYPNAVLLSREQYESLVREAGQVRKAAPHAPRPATLTSASYQARVSGKVAQVTATFTVEVLSDEWAQLPLKFGGVALGAVTVDGEAAFFGDARGKLKSGAGAPIEPGSLFLRGKGERTVVMEFSVPIVSSKGVSSFEIQLPPAAASVFDLALPPDQRVESPQSIAVKRTPETTAVTATLSPANPKLTLNWRGPGARSQALAAQMAAIGTYTIDAVNVRSEYELDFRTPLGNLAGAYSMALPANTKVLQVTGDAIAKWEIADGKLWVALQPGERAAAKIRLAMETPSLAAGSSARLTLPVPRFEGVSRVQGTFSIIGDEGVIIKEIANDHSVESVNPTANPGPHWVASYRFITPPNSPQVTVEKVQPRFSADLDTRVEFKQEAIFIERTLTLHPEKGEIFEVALTLPVGEELMTVRNANGSEPDWRAQDRKVSLRWTNDAGDGAGRQFKIRTRAEPATWSQISETGLPFTVGDLKIDGAERVTGYIALKADEAFRLEAEPSETLERRDGRATPVEGDYAWFRGADFTLQVKVAKRPGEVLAALTGYALPLEGVLDLHAQIDYNFLHSGVRSVRIRVPKEIATNFHFDGPQIAERNLAGDVWTIVFQRELTGGYAMKVSGQVAVARTDSVSKPGDGPEAASEEESRFEIAIPVIAPLDVVRTSGVWVIEANTETEVTFAAKGMNELDSLRAPGLADYQPRHRVIGVFTWLGPDYSLTLSGVRHAAASVLTSVVDRLDLDTVVSASGTERNQATFELRTAGAQYIDVQLPEESRLLSLSVNDEAIKPVGDRPDQVRVELPGTTTSDGALKVSVLYETPKPAWRASGGYSVHAPKLAQSIPILRSQWRLFLPDGFEYTGIESNLRVPAMDPEAPLLVEIWNGWILRRRIPSSRVDIAQPNALTWQPQHSAESQRLKRESRRSPAADQIHAHANEGMQAKMNRIVIPDLDLHEVTLPEAIEFLKRRSVELDADSPPGQRGVNLYLKGDANLSNRISVKLTNIPVIEALRYVTSLANMRFDVTPYTVFIAPASVNTDVLVTSEWTIRPDIIPKSLGAKAWLESIGMQFNGPGASAIYLPGSTHLVITNTQEQLDLMHRLVESGGWGAPYEPPRHGETLEKLERIVIPKLDLHDVTIREAIDYLKRESFELDDFSPQGDKGVNFVLKEDPGNWSSPAPEAPPPAVPIPGLEPIPAAPGVMPGVTPSPNPTDPRITVSLTDIPLIEALRYVTGLASLKFKVETHAVLIEPSSVNTDILVTKEWKVRPNLVPDGSNARAWLESIGVKFYSPAASAVYLPGSDRLIMRNSQEQLDLMDSLLEAGAELAPVEPAPKEGIPGKLARIVIPKLDLHNATLQEAIEFLKRQSIELDDFSPPNGKGVNFELSLDSENGLGPNQPPGIPGAATQSLANARITISLTNIPLIDALGYVTRLANVKFSVQPDAVLIVPANVNTDRLVTREYTIRPDLVPRVPRAGAEINPLSLGPTRAGRGAVVQGDATKGQKAIADQESAKNWLISNGVTIGPGASAVYLPGSSKLIVRDTQDQLDLVDTIIEANQTGGNRRGANPGSQREQSEDAKREADFRAGGDPKLRAALEQKLERIIVPRMEFKDATLAQVLDFLRAQANDLDTESSAEERGVRIELDSSAMRKSAANQGASNSQIPRITISLTNIPLMEALRYVTGLLGLKFVVTDRGVSIEGTSLNSVPAAGVPVIPTAEPAQEAPKPAEPQRVSGLIPMKLDLPKIGGMIVLDGLSAADRVQFRYENWWTRASHLWLWFVAGGLVCPFVARRRPWWRTCWVALALTFFPLVAVTSATPVCNALLAGWLVSLVIQRVAARLVFAPSRKEATA